MNELINDEQRLPKKNLRTAGASKSNQTISLLNNDDDDDDDEL